MYIYIYLHPPKGCNFSLRSKISLFFVRAEISACGLISQFGRKSPINKQIYHSLWQSYHNLMMIWIQLHGSKPMPFVSPCSSWRGASPLAVHALQDSIPAADMWSLQWKHDVAFVIKPLFWVTGSGPSLEPCPFTLWWLKTLPSKLWGNKA